MKTLTKILLHNVCILIADGFEEKLVVTCLSHMREAGIAVLLVGLIPGLVESHCGLKVRSDISIDRLPDFGKLQLVLVPGGRRCASTLVSDPRTHRLIEATLEQGGFVAAAPEAHMALAKTGIPALSAVSRFLKQDHLEVPEFVNRLVNLTIPA